MVEKENLGITVREKNISDLVSAISKLADDKDYYDKCVRNIENTAKEYTWEKVCEPLIRFCKDPVISAYKKKLKENDFAGKGNSDLPDKNAGKYGGKHIGYLTKKFLYHLTHNGPGKTFKYVSNYLKGK